MNTPQKFNKIVKDIKSIKIQGARNIAKYALEAYFLIPTKKSKEILIKTRLTEPMLHKVLNEINRKSYYEVLGHFDFAQSEINKNVFKIIKDNDKIFTHCHSTNVINSLIYSRKQGRKFEVFNTETRPLFQGRKTVIDLEKAKIKVTMFVDSAVASILEKDSKKDKVYATKVFLGADAILKNGIINKVGSKMIAELALKHKIPVYIIADSWKFSKSNISIEQRSLNEVWDKAPQNIKIQNPAFEFVPKKYISGIISELGILNYEKFLKKVNEK